MAMTADSQTLTSPWAQVVRGGADDAPPPPESEETSAAAENKPKKAAWSKPVGDGVSETVISPLMTWPALSESTKPSPRSSPPLDSVKVASDDSILSLSQGLPVIPQSPQKQSSGSNAKSSNNAPGRQRSFKRVGGGNSAAAAAAAGGSSSGSGHAQNGFNHPPPPPPPPPPFPFPIVPNGYGNLVPVMPNHSPREHTFRPNNWEPRLPGGFSPQPRGLNDHRHAPRKGNLGGRGDGSNHNSHGGSRHDQDRGHHGTARDGNVQPQRASPRGFRAPPPPNGVAFVPSQPVRPYPNSMGYPEFVYVPVPLDPYGTFMPPPPPPPPPLVMPFANASLPGLILYQIEYYFSDANLVKDDYLKSNMDEEGWVPINLIAGFNRVRSLTSDIGLILESLRSSTLVEVQNEKIRRRDDWNHWLPSSGRLPSDTGTQLSAVSTSFQKVTLEDAADNQSATTDAHPQSEEDRGDVQNSTLRRFKQNEATEAAVSGLEVAKIKFLY